MIRHVRRTPFFPAFIVSSGIFFAALFAPGCGRDDGGTLPEPARTGCGTNVQGSRAGHWARKSLFVISDYTSSTIVCSFDFDTKAFREEFVLPSNSNDVEVYKDRAGTDVVVAERWSSRLGLPSRVTRLGVDGEVAGEAVKLPLNIHDLFKINPKSFLTVGYDLGEAAVFSTVFQGSATAFSAPTKVLAGLAGKRDDPDSRLGMVLSVPGRTYVLSTGYDLSKEFAVAARPAKIHRLSQDLGSVESTVEIKSADGASTCVNAWSLQRISATRAVLGCNVQGGGRTPSTQAATLVALVDVDASQEPPRITFLKSFPSNEGASVAPKGVSADGTKVFVETERYAEGSDTETVRTSAWLDLATGAETAVTRFGGAVSYNAAARSYLFQCHRPSGAGACVPKAMALVPEGDALVDKAGKVLPFDPIVSFYGFEKSLAASP